MNIPDYVSPIIGHRAWQCDDSGLNSLNGEHWPSGLALTARCKMASDRHQAPQKRCTCGVYAARSLDQLRDIGYAAFAIYGEVYLWGVVIEHELGWRAQFAYPKNLVVPFEMMPVDEKEAESHLEALVSYGVDVFVDDGERHIPLWKRGSGYESPGRDYVRKVTSGQVEVAAPIAILKEDPRRHILLQNGRVVNHSAEIVFTDVRLPVNAPDPITYQLRAPHVMAVVFDLRPGNVRLTSHAINVIHMASIDIDTASANIAIFIRLDRRNPVNIPPGMHMWVDEYLDYDGRYDVQFAFKRFVRRRKKPPQTRKSEPPGGAVPPGGPAGPPGLPPPPPVAVHSSWDISRIFQCV